MQTDGKIERKERKERLNMEREKSRNERETKRYEQMERETKGTRD